VRGSLHPKDGAHKHNRESTGIGNEGAEADQHGEQHSIGNLQNGEHQELAPAEDQGQDHLTSEIPTKGSTQRGGHQLAPSSWQPLGETSCDRVGSQKQKHRQHQHESRC
jgi:hypothetical protein